jgi:hypothetical protein
MMMMMEAVRTSETSVDNHFTRQYNPEDSSEHHTCRRENLKSHKELLSEQFSKWKFRSADILLKSETRNTTIKMEKR